jgi:glyoxylase-like metal-dependent hydrolase (beta-lactamase superfamily II)
LSSGNGHHKEQYELRAVPVGEGDTVNSTVLYVPEVKTVLTGDIVYGNCYQYLAEKPTAELRSQWLKSIDKVAGLHPQYVIPSHALPTDNDERNHLTETKTYIETFEQLLAESSSWQELETSLKGRFPEREGSFILRYSTHIFQCIFLGSL